VISGAGVSDTILTVLPQVLVVEVVDGTGNGVPNQAVTFNPVIGQSAYPGLAFPSASGGQVVVTTDGRGYAETRIHFSANAGPAAIAVSDQGGGRGDTAHFTVRPGAPTGVGAIPSDTAVYVGHQFALRGAIVDQWGNPVDASVQYSAPSAEISIAAGVLSGVQIGRGSYVVSGTVAGVRKVDTGRVSVVPPGVLAATDNGNIYIFNTDGSAFHRVLTNVRNSDPRWSPSGAEIAYDESMISPMGSDLGGPDSLIHTVDTLGNVRTISSPAIGGVHQGPQYSHDGVWIYFARFPGNFKGNPGGPPSLWRMHTDGSSAAPVTVATPGAYGYPSPSPDGSQLAFELMTPNGPFDWGGTVESLMLSTGALTPLSVSGNEPVWSPTDTLILYIQTTFEGDDQGPIWVIHPDGTGQRQVGTGTYGPGFDWSPDGVWIAAYGVGGFRIEIVNVQTGLRLPLNFLPLTLVSVTWRP